MRAATAFLANLTLANGSHVDVVVKEALPIDANSYGLKPREMANVFRREADMLVALQHRNVIRYFGGCFAPNRTFNVVEALKQWSDVVLKSRLSFRNRLAIALDVARWRARPAVDRLTERSACPPRLLQDDQILQLGPQRARRAALLRLLAAAVWL